MLRIRDRTVAGNCYAIFRQAWRCDPNEEPHAFSAHVWICPGARGNPGPYRDAQARSTPNPQQPLGLPGRSQPRLCFPGGPRRPESNVQDSCGQAHPPPRRCASPERKGAHRHPTSFSGAYTVLTRGAACAQITRWRTPGKACPERPALS